MVAAKSKMLVDEALEAIEVEYEELPGVYTIDDALIEGAPLVHEEYKNNIFTDSYYPIRKGDVEKGFAEADVILERNIGHSILSILILNQRQHWHSRIRTVD